jgi:aryl-alcohol dehydrogenase
MPVITAAVAREQGKPLAIEQLSLDDLRSNEARIRMVASGVCHTDAIVRDGAIPTPLPVVLGHEGAGIVEEVGADVTGVRPGDHVVLSAAYCARCAECQAGHMAYCENLFAQDFGGCRPDGSTALSDANGAPVSSHFLGQSSFGSHAHAVETSLVPVPPSAPLEVLAPLGRGLQTGAGSVLNELRPPAGPRSRSPGREPSGWRP